MPVELPVALPVELPVELPDALPVELPVELPVALPVDLPVELPVHWELRHDNSRTLIEPVLQICMAIYRLSQIDQMRPNLLPFLDILQTRSSSYGTFILSFMFISQTACILFL